MGKLSENGKMIFETQFDCSSLKEVKDNYFPERSINEIIKAMNAVGKIYDGEVTSWMEIFFEGMKYGEEKIKRKLSKWFRGLTVDAWNFNDSFLSFSDYMISQLEKFLKEM